MLEETCALEITTFFFTGCWNTKFLWFRAQWILCACFDTHLFPQHTHSYFSLCDSWIFECLFKWSFLLKVFPHTLQVNFCKIWKIQREKNYCHDNSSILYYSTKYQLTFCSTLLLGNAAIDFFSTEPLVLNVIVAFWIQWLLWWTDVCSKSAATHFKRLAIWLSENGLSQFGNGRAE